MCIQFTGKNHLRPNYIFVEKTATGSKQPAFILACLIFPFDKIKVVDKVLEDKISRIIMIIIGKQKAHFLNVIPDSTWGISLSVQNSGKF
jgi:hypothetical protein